MNVNHQNVAIEVIQEDQDLAPDQDQEAGVNQETSLADLVASQEADRRIEKIKKMLRRMVLKTITVHLVHRRVKKIRRKKIRHILKTLILFPFPDPNTTCKLLDLY